MFGGKTQRGEVDQPCEWIVESSCGCVKYLLTPCLSVNETLDEHNETLHFKMQCYPSIFLQMIPHNRDSFYIVFMSSYVALRFENQGVLSFTGKSRSWVWASAVKNCSKLKKAELHQQKIQRGKADRSFCRQTGKPARKESSHLWATYCWQKYKSNSQMRIHEE